MRTMRHNGRMRIAFSGPSGTGKTTLAKYVSEKYGLPMNPVGARSVSQAMGFATPYDVDKAGKRAEFQKRLAEEKMAWEDEHASFVTDRTTFDNLVYTMLHDVHAVDESLFEAIKDGMCRYTHIVMFPMHQFCDPGSDKDRVKDLTYHRLYEATLVGLFECYFPTRVHVLEYSTIELRQRWADQHFQSL